MERAPTARLAPSPPAPDPLFGRVLVGVDDTPESVVAAAQARTLTPPGGRLSLLAVAETYFAAHAGAAARFAEGGLETETADVLEQASELAAPDERRFTAGRLADVLQAECRRSDATLVAIGARPQRRLIQHPSQGAAPGSEPGGSIGFTCSQPGAAAG